MINEMIDIELQQVSTLLNIPSRKAFKKWIELALKDLDLQGSITLRIVDEIESAELNHQYRQKNKPTNVLAFPYYSEDIIGDLVICAPIVKKEAEEQDKELTAHWAHLVIHGCLHLIGYDHIEEDEAKEMEALEILKMQQLGFPNPYEEVE